MRYRRKTRKQIISTILLVQIVLTFWVGSAPALAAVEFDVNAKAALLMVPETGQILYSKNIDEQLPPASIAKIMTLLLAMEAVESGRVQLDDPVRVSARAESMGGSQVWLAEGEVFTLEELLRAVAIPSANDAAVAVAEHVAGSVEAFVAAMNRRAQELGMKNTIFTNVTGLPAEADEQPTLTTVRDIAKMACELLKYPKVLEWTSTRHAVFRTNPRTDLWNTNKLIGVYPGVDGLKTGYTSEAGFCLVATAMQGDLRLLSIVMNTESDAERTRQTERLLNMGFRGFAKQEIVKQGAVLGEIRVKDGVPEYVSVIAAQDLAPLVPHGRADDVQTEFIPRGAVAAPMEKGTKVGVYQATLDGELLGTVDAVIDTDVDRANWFIRLWRFIRDLVRSLLSFGRE